MGQGVSSLPEGVRPWMFMKEHWSDRRKEQILDLYNQYGQQIHNKIIHYNPLEYALSFNNLEAVEFFCLMNVTPTSMELDPGVRHQLHY